MDLEQRSFAIDGFAVEEREGKGPVIRGHAAVFDQLSDDLGGFRERILPGAFAEAIVQDDVRGLFNHDVNFVLGRNRAGTLRLAEDQKGLAFEIDAPATPTIRDLVLEPMRRGDVTQMSFKFQVRMDGQDWAVDEDGVTIRTLKKLRLFDISPVVFPAYPQTDAAVRELRAWQAEQAKPPVLTTPFNLLRARLKQAGA